MIFPLAVALAFTLATLLLAVLVSIVLAILRRPQRTFWRRVLWLHAALFPLHLFVTFPAAIGLIGSRGLNTRPDERNYNGPVGGERHTIESSDGVTLRAFRLPASQQKPVAICVLVHGLFRSAKELEPVAAMFHELGCECWLVEVRNFGGSSRAPFTGGLRESDDVVAAVGYARAQAADPAAPTVLFGVSFGTVAVSLALPRLDHIAGVVLDAPIDDLLAAAHRLLAFNRPGDVRSWFRMAEPWQSLIVHWLEFWSDFRLRDVSAVEVLATLPPDLPVLVVGAGIDDRAPPASVERLYERLPTLPDRKQYWSVPTASHGHVFLVAAPEYREHLRWLLEHLRR